MKLFNLLLCLVCAGMMSSCDNGGDETDGVISVTGVAMKSATSILVGGTETLTATVTPSDATNKKVTWMSSDATVATVDKGVVTALKAGATTITVTTEDGGHTATCEVTVSNMVIAVTGVTMDKPSASLIEGETATLTATITPADATNQNLTWGSSDATVATVDKGVVTALKAGTTTITATTEDGGHTATCAVTVSKATVAVTGVGLDKTTASLDLSEPQTRTVTLTATVAPADATNKNVTWTSSDETVATVAAGVVTAVKVGATTITVTTEEGGHTATCAVTVVDNALVLNDTAGKLSEQITDAETRTVLKIKGTLNAADFTYIRSLPKLLEVDLSQTDLTKIPAGALSFSGVHASKILQKIVLPESLVEIEKNAFSGCESLTYINMPASVRKLGDQMFMGVKSLEWIDGGAIPNGVALIPSSAYCGLTSLKELVIPASVTTVNTRAFQDCSSLKTLTLPATVTYWNDDTKYGGGAEFKGCTGLESVVIEEGLKTIVAEMFSGCKSLKSVRVPSSVTEIKKYAFSGCESLETIELPSGLTKLYQAAFQYSGLTTITIPNGVKEIPSDAFRSCLALRSIQLPASLTLIDSFAFKEVSMPVLELPATIQTLKSSVFINANIPTLICRATTPPKATLTTDNAGTFYNMTKPNVLKVSDPAAYSAWAPFFTEILPLE